MRTGQRRSALAYIPGYKNNGVLKLIIFCTVAYLLLAITWAIFMMVYGFTPVAFDQYIIPNVALGRLSTFPSHFWVILTYGWFQYPNSFMELVSNMLWMYCFGSVVQMLIGHKQVAPLFAYSLFAGGLLFMATQVLPLRATVGDSVYLGSNAGLMGLAVAAITLTPSYRFYVNDRFSIPLMLIAGVFVMLMLLNSGFLLPRLMLLTGGGVMGYIYVRMLKSGVQPAEWIYTIANKVESLVTPSERMEGKIIPFPSNRSQQYEPKRGITQRHIDDILDKINQKGYNSLSKEEKEMLLRAGRE